MNQKMIKLYCQSLVNEIEKILASDDHWKTLNLAENISAYATQLHSYCAKECKQIAITFEDDHGSL
jgi:hypothetical protein